jgi:hypothetical protein
MNCFSKEKSKNSTLVTLLLPAAIFIVVFVLVLTGVSHLSTSTDEQERNSLEQAVWRSATQCYALEGAYPQSLDYLMEHYGVTYDESKYLVHYEVFGSNMLPVIQVITRNEEQ